MDRQTAQGQSKRVRTHAAAANRWSRVLGGALIACLAVAGVAWGQAPSASTKLIGSSCRHQLQLFYAADSASDTSGVLENHALDSRFLHLTVTHTDAGAGPKPRHYVVRWSLGPGVKLCPGRVRIGYGNETAITKPTGVVEGDVTPRGPVRVKLRGYLAQAIHPRSLGRRQLKALITGWARRACQLRSSQPAASKLLEDLADRGHAQGCSGPGGSSVPSRDVLLHHLSAYFKNERGGAVPTSRNAASMGAEYYRTLHQLTTGAPTPPTAR